MIHHAWSVLCSLSSLDKETNNLSLFNVLEQFNIAGPREDERGLLPIACEIDSLWVRLEGKPARGFTRTVVVGPSGETHPTKEMMVDLAGDVDRFRTRLRMVGLPFLGYGVYWMDVEFRPDGSDKWDRVARVPLQVSSIGGDAEK